MTIMQGAIFILAINVFAAGLLAAAFVAIAVHEPARIEARWFASAYVAGTANFALEFAIPFANGAPVVVMAAFATFLLALAIFNVGIARLYRHAVPWRMIGAIFVAGIVLKLFSETMPRESALRIAVYHLPYVAMQGVSLWMAWPKRRQSTLDALLVLAIAATTVHYASKPVVMHFVGGAGRSAQEYAGTNYAMISQSAGTVLAMTVALLLILILVRSLLTAITVKSETDKLSGLLNRRGFEERRDAALRLRDINGLPVSLVVCDLDHFKDINDTLGHAAGDLVISGFAQLVGSAVASHQIAGRIGGEEFAILLPGSNLASARLFAENLRGRWAETELPGLGRRFTASFGVAELVRGEGAVELHARADAALYEAKRGGRDRVQVSFAQRTNPAQRQRA